MRVVGLVAALHIDAWPLLPLTVVVARPLSVPVPDSELPVARVVVWLSAVALIGCLVPSPREEREESEHAPMTGVTEVACLEPARVVALVAPLVAIPVRVLVELRLERGALALRGTVARAVDARLLTLLVRFRLRVAPRLLWVVLTEPVYRAGLNQRPTRLARVVRLDRCCDALVLALTQPLLLVRLVVPLRALVLVMQRVAQL